MSVVPQRLRAGEDDRKGTTCQSGLGGGGEQEKKKGKGKMKIRTGWGIKPRVERAREVCLRKNDGRVVFCKIDVIFKFSLLRIKIFSTRGISVKKIRARSLCTGASLDYGLIPTKHEGSSAKRNGQIGTIG